MRRGGRDRMMLRKIAVMLTVATVLGLAVHHPLLLSDDCQGCSGTIADASLGTAAANMGGECTGCPSSGANCDHRGDLSFKSSRGGPRGALRHRAASLSFLAPSERAFSLHGVQ
jgi:hypothetical protein